VKNAGSTIGFSEALGFWIGSQFPQDNLTWGNNRWALGGVVMPNDALTVTLNLTAPTQPGTHRLALRMVQDGVTWFGDTLDFSATVGSPSVGGVPRTCLLTGLTIGLSLVGQAPGEMLDGARLVRAQLQQTDPGVRLMQLYTAISESGEVQSLIANDPRLLAQCLSFASKIGDLGHLTPTQGLLSALSSSMPEFERIVDVLHARSSPQTQEKLAEVRQRLKAINA
jgi:hypothetical protein